MISANSTGLSGRRDRKCAKAVTKSLHDKGAFTYQDEAITAIMQMIQPSMMPLKLRKNQ